MKKIMFNEHYGLTRLVKEGIKTNTRRVLPEKLQLKCDNCNEIEVLDDHFVLYFDDHCEKIPLPYKIGEIVAVAQSYSQILEENNFFIVESTLWHKLNAIKSLIASGNNAGLRNKMFVRADLMPLQIRFIGVHIERLQDINYLDCLNEGILRCERNVYKIWGHLEYWETPHQAFAYLIDKVSGKGRWERNPFVLAYEFELIR